MEKGFCVDIVNPIYIEDEIVSSTMIRSLIEKGFMDKANKLLGRYYTIIGTVVKGKNRGNTMGYPTANIQLDYNYVVPKPGVYETITRIWNKEYLGLTSIGCNPTFGEEELKIENHILDFNTNIYGKIIELKFARFIRGNKKFNTVRELIEQIQKDVMEIKK